ncbi:MAG: hypothetical protein KJP18_17205 [Gemmatimonadetes bacterium]|nr:hypothetical protein [Gemmatimonadota bacterium]NNF38494.1 hypothetical protein [Gemmatimonadota bacterium]
MAEDIKTAQRKLTDRVMGRPGVIGTAIGMSRGDHCLKVLIADDRGRRGVPREVDGYKVVVEHTGRIRRR